MTDAHDPHDHDHAPGPDAAPGSRSLPVIEEPLDPASQSLADALRASFRVLKFIMFVVVICFVFSGFYIVPQNEVVVRTHFGKRDEDLKKPGLHMAWPFPIDEKIRVPKDTKTLEIKSFWMKLTKEQELQPLSRLVASNSYLQPGVDGALLTAVDTRAGTSRAGASRGAELVHAKWNVSYHIENPLDFVENVADEKATVESAFDAASVAMAARSTVDEIAFQNQSQFRVAVQEDAQRRLDAIRSGIRIDKVNSVTYQPLQVRAEFDAVITAENNKRKVSQAADQERKRILNEAAGEAYPVIAEAIREYERVWLGGRPPEELARLEAKIDELLTTTARGKAAEIVKTARAQSDQIVQQLQADAATVRKLKPRYEQHPVLLPERMWQATRREIFASDGVTRFFLPDGIQRFVLWLNRDPKQQKEQLQKEIEAAKKKP